MTLYTADRLAEMLGIQRSTVQQLVRAGEFGPTVNVARKHLVTEDGLAEFIARRTGPAHSGLAPRTANQLSPPAQRPWADLKGERQCPKQKQPPRCCSTSDGQTKNFITCILPHISPICKAFANFTLTACGLGALCAVAALAQGGGAASLAGLAACLLGGWAAITLREVATCAES